MPGRPAAFDPEKQAALADAVSQMSADDAALLLEKLAASLERRKYQLIGFLLAAVTGFLGLVVAFIVYLMREPGTFVGWVFLLPFVGVGLSLFIFGRIAERVGRGGLPVPPRQKAAPK